jgi:hypothetical protein
LLRVIYNLLRERGAWPTFRTVDFHFDRRFGIADAQAALPTLLAFVRLEAALAVGGGGRPQCAQAKLNQRSPGVIMGGLPAGTAGGECDSEVSRASLLEH